MAKTPMPSPELLRKLLRYQPETGKLYWRKNGREAFTAIGSHGYHAGHIRPYGTLLAHRVMAAMVLGYWPPCVDHDNRKKTDNRWRNLKPTTHSGNHKNHPIRVDNKSGVTGVYRVGQNGKWRAMIHDDGRPRRLGDFTDMMAAIAARHAAEIEYGYHPNHGRA